MTANEPRGLLFNRVAEEYDRVRRGYPDELVDAACSIAGLGEGSRVVEVGCGTGKLTRALAERGLEIDAVDPGPELVAIARARAGGTATARFHIVRFEDVELPARTYEALFSATAFHWVDPDVSWSKAAELLRPDGVLALLTHVGAFDELFGRLVEGLRRTDPDLVATSHEASCEAAWGARDRETVWRGAESRRGNISELWSWIAKRDLARPEAARLFEDVHLERVDIELDETADQLIALLRTTSAHLSFDAERRRRIEQKLRALVEEAGGTYRSTLVAILATARARA